MSLDRKTKLAFIFLLLNISKFNFSNTCAVIVQELIFRAKHAYFKNLRGTGLSWYHSPKVIGFQITTPYSKWERTTNYHLVEPR